MLNRAMQLMLSLVVQIGLTDYLTNVIRKRPTLLYRNMVAKTGVMPMPKVCTLEITMRCNLNCSICHQNKRKKETEEMTTGQVFNALDKIKDAGIKLAYITGGESFLRKDIGEIFEYLDKIKLPFKINSNMTILTDNHISLINNSKMLKCIGTSIDGDRERHDAARGKPGAYDLTVLALKKIKCRKNVTFVPTENNRGTLEHVLKLAKKLNVATVNYIFEMYNTENEIENTERVIGKVFVNSKDRKESAAETRGTIESVKKLSKRYGILVNIVPHHFIHNSAGCPVLFCRSFGCLYVNLRGNVQACQFAKYETGSILESSVREIWNNKPMRDMREIILSHDTMLPICRRCCVAVETKA